MNAKQELFCEIYAQTKNATQAAIGCGYSAKSAYNQGSRLLKNDEVQKRIRQLIEEQCGTLPTKTELKQFWANLMRDETQKASVRLAASTYLAKSLFMFNYDVSGWDETKESED